MYRSSPVFKHLYLSAYPSLCIWVSCYSVLNPVSRITFHQLNSSWDPGKGKVQLPEQTFWDGKYFLYLDIFNYSSAENHGLHLPVLSDDSFGFHGPSLPWVPFGTDSLSLGTESHLTFIVVSRGLIHERESCMNKGGLKIGCFRGLRMSGESTQVLQMWVRL